MPRWPFGVLMLALLAMPAARAEDAQSVLGDAVAKYQMSPRLAVECAFVSYIEGNAARDSQQFTLAFVRPDFYRVALRRGTAFEQVVARDGDTVTWYLPAFNQYVERPADRLPVPTPPGAVARMLLRDEDGIAGLWPIPAGAAVSLQAQRVDGRLVRTVTVATGDATSICRIDPKTGLIVSIERTEKVGSSDGEGTGTRVTREVYHYIAIGNRATELARFVPPEGAARVERPKIDANLVGGEAPAFRLLGLDGHYRDLAALRGQVVMLNFWAPW